MPYDDPERSEKYNWPYLSHNWPAAVLVEPMLGSSGCFVGKPLFVLSTEHYSEVDALII